MANTNLKRHPRTQVAFRLDSFKNKIDTQLGVYMVLIENNSPESLILVNPTTKPLEDFQSSLHRIVQVAFPSSSSVRWDSGMAGPSWLGSVLASQHHFSLFVLSTWLKSYTEPALLFFWQLQLLLQLPNQTQHQTINHHTGKQSVWET